MDIIIYWICASILVGLEALFLANHHETLSIICIGLIWLITVIGFGIETMKFSDYLKSKYPSEYINMLNKKRMSIQLKYRPNPNDPLLERYQNRLRHYLQFILFGIFSPIGILVLFMLD